jgi:tRNA pseudouridine55 synthase
MRPGPTCGPKLRSRAAEDSVSRITSGVLVVDKPRGPTSHEVVVRVRRALGVREVGHAGTLDPMATGVLVVAVGEATKLVPWLTAQDKTYEATIALGVETDTLDADGGEVRRVPAGDELRAALASSPSRLALAPILCAALSAERSRVSQVPPTFSALRQGGERAYTRARRGDHTALPPRQVNVRRRASTSCSMWARATTCARSHATSPSPWGRSAT